MKLFRKTSFHFFREHTTACAWENETSICFPKARTIKIIFLLNATFIYPYRHTNLSTHLVPKSSSTMLLKTNREKSTLFMPAEKSISLTFTPAAF